MLYQLSYASPETAICRCDDPTDDLSAGVHLRNRLPTRNHPAVIKTNVRAHSHCARTTAQNARLAHATTGSKHRITGTPRPQVPEQAIRSPVCKAFRQLHCPACDEMAMSNRQGHEDYFQGGKSRGR